MTNTKIITDNGKQLIESLFETHVKVAGKSKTGTIRMTGERLNGKKGHEEDYRVYAFTYMLKMQKKYGFELGYGEEFIGVFAGYLSLAIAELGDRFPDFEVYKRDKQIQNKTNKYLKSHIRKSLVMATNPHRFQTRSGKQNVFIDPEGGDVVSLDALKERSLENNGYFELSDSNRLHKIDEDEYYQFNALVQHFLNNRNRILTNKQNQFYEEMAEAYVPAKHVVTKKQAFKEAGYTINQFNRYKGEILKRTLVDFEQFGTNESLSLNSRTKLHKVFKQFLAVVDTKLNTHLAPLNLSVILRENYENEEFEITITKGLSTKDKQHIVRVVKGKHFVSNKVAYKIAGNIEEYLENNPIQKVEPSEVESTYTEGIFNSKQKDSKETHFTINAAGVATPRKFGDIEIETSEVKVMKLEEVYA
ncbi:hypothetical protein AALF85_05310 [Jeotgalicoccus halotolerans]|uniref:hypothetical protein n=1 Tax=Jeotgalicoccus halotolerans TaxID=157227 RepID=UPI003518568F